MINTTSQTRNDIYDYKKMRTYSRSFHYSWLLYVFIKNFRSVMYPWLHTLTLVQLEHHHPVSQQYTFAIPEVHTKCVCDCNPASDICSARTHSFTICNSTSNSVVYLIRIFAITIKNNSSINI